MRDGDFREDLVFEVELVKVGRWGEEGGEVKGVVESELDYDCFLGLIV